MWLSQKKYRKSAKPFILLAFLLFDISLTAQQKVAIDTIKLTFPDKPVRINRIGSFSFTDTLLNVHQSLIPWVTSNDRGTSGFLDTLKTKASKTLITRKLYDFLVVSGPAVPAHQINNSSDRDYSRFSGKRIRKIEIRRLSVFGANINNPIASNPNKLESLVNKTHINTNESIIRKNLLFSEGDTVSPLTLSDNERILRQLPYIDDSRILAVPVSDDEVDILVLTKDVYSLGASFDYSSISKGTVSVFDKNIFGMGHEFRIEVPYNSDLPDSPGFGIKYNINNIRKSFINLQLFYSDGLGEKTYGFDLEKKHVSSETKYAGGISFRHMSTTEDLDTLILPEPLKYNLQDYWFSRSFLINKESVTRIILGARYTNNNVFNHPFILPDSYYNLQQYRLFLGSVSFSAQKYYKTSLIYSYGRTEDIPHGGLFNLTMGKEINEFKKRLYTGISLSAGESIRSFGYFYAAMGIATFFHENYTEQGILMARASYFSNLLYLGSNRLRNFIKVDYTRGFDRFYDESLSFVREDGFSGFKNDSVSGAQRLSLGLESVLFSPINFHGFRFAFFGFADLGILFGTNEFVRNGEVLSSIGLGIRIRNDNLVFNTFQIRLGYFPNLPQYSRVNYFLVSGEQLLKPENFDPGPPIPLPYR
jgi:hypothetical protein